MFRVSQPQLVCAHPIQTLGSVWVAYMPRPVYRWPIRCNYPRSSIQTPFPALNCPAGPIWGSPQANRLAMMLWALRWWWGKWGENNDEMKGYRMAWCKKDPRWGGGIISQSHSAHLPSLVSNLIISYQKLSRYNQIYMVLYNIFIKCLVIRFQAEKVHLLISFHFESFYENL